MMKVILSTARLFSLVFLCAGLALAQGPSTTTWLRASRQHLAPVQSASPSALSSQYEPRQKMLLIADNQEHLLTGGPIKSSSGRTDRYVTSVALRSPLANVGGRLLMREALKFGREQGAGLVLHLGDAADISCPDELSAVFDALDEETPGKMWFMAPGNHDGLFAGNFAGYQESLDAQTGVPLPFYEGAPGAGYGDIPRKWFNACLSPSNYDDPARADILTRGDAISLYVERLKQRQGASQSALEPETVTMELKNGKTVDISCPVEKIELKSYGYSAIARICPRAPVPGDPKKHWVGAYASFIIQKLDVEGNRIVVLDTSDYAKASKWIDVIRRGEIAEDQEARVRDFFMTDNGEKLDRRKVIVAGHHPFAQLPESDREWIAKKAGRYISAHVHASASLVKHTVEGSGVAELNLGSTLDFPPQAAIAYIGADSMHVRVAGADISKTGWPAFLSECEENEKKWKLESRELYTDYRDGLYVTHLLESLRKAAAQHAATVGHAEPRLVIPADADVNGWRLLDTALQTINEAEGKSRTFWACQAYYASYAASQERGFLAEIAAPFVGLGFKRGSDVTGGWLSFSSL